MTKVSVRQRAFFLVTMVAAAATVTAVLVVTMTKAEPQDWPAFTMTYLTQGPAGSVEVHRFEFQSKNEWLDTVIDAVPVETDYGVFSREGSYQRLSGQQFTEFDAMDNSTGQDTISEGVRFVPNGILVPFQNRAMQEATGRKPERTTTTATVCFRDQCTQNAEGLVYILDGREWVYANDSRGFPLRTGSSFTVRELRIDDEKR